MVGLGLNLGISKAQGGGGGVPAVDLVIFAGQSNADGRAPIGTILSSTEVFYNTLRPSLGIYYKPAQRTGATVTAGSFADDGELYTLSDVHSSGSKTTHQTIGAASSSVATQSNLLFGPELSFGKKWVEQYGDREVYILKAAVGNAGINNQWDAENAGSSSLWTFFKTYIYNPAVADIEALDKRIGRIFFIWMQGQADAENSTLANDYENQLNFLYDRVDSELTDGTSVQIIDIGVPAVQAASTNGQIVQAAKIKVAGERSNVYFLPSDGSSIYPVYESIVGDDPHFSAQGYEDQQTDVFKLFVANTLPIFVSAPVISGTAEIGQTLTTTNGVWLNGTSFTYQWQLGGVDIGGATSSTFVVANSGNHTCIVTPVQSGAYPSTSNTIAVAGSYVDPTDVSNTQYWGDATSGDNTVVSNRISVWFDQTGNGNSATSSGSSRPSSGTRTVNGNNTIDFDGSDDFMTLSKTLGNGLFATTAKPFTVFIGGSVDTTGTLIARGVSNSSQRTIQLADDGSDMVLTVRGTQNVLISSYSGTNNIYVLRWDGTTFTAYVDGGSAIAVTVGTQSENTGEDIILGARTGGTGFFLNGFIVDPIIMDAAASIEDINNNGNYMATRLGTTWTDVS